MPLLAQPAHVPCVYLDANVLLPEYLRSVFLDLADAGLIQVHWGLGVLAEVRRNLCGPKFGQSLAVAERLLHTLAKAFPDAVVLGSGGLEKEFNGKTDSKDRHVAAGALKLCERLADDSLVFLITSNIKHLPAHAFAGTKVRVQAPGPFLEELLAQQPDVAQVLSRMIARFTSPPVSKEDLLQILDHSGCQTFATALAKAWGFEAV